MLITFVQHTPEGTEKVSYYNEKVVGQRRQTFLKCLVFSPKRGGGGVGNIPFIGS